MKMNMLVKKNSDSIGQVASLLKSGEICIIPTDTVYGFSGIADLFGKTTFCSDKKIFRVKGRPESKPLIQLISSPEDIRRFTDADIPRKLLDLWPGALTIIVPVKKEIYGFPAETVAFRCPGDSWLRSIIAEVGAPIFSTSVNKSGEPVLDRIDEIVSVFGEDVPLIVDDGDKSDSKPSTIVLLENDGFRIIRQGAVEIRV